MDGMDMCSYVWIKAQRKLNCIMKAFSFDFSKSTNYITIIISISYMNPRSGIGLAAMIINWFNAYSTIYRHECKR
jgi:hypothetical protein